MFGIEFEPLSLREIGGIKDTIPPMGIIITACADEDHFMGSAKLRINSACRRRITKFEISNEIV